ncbi:hypothetical protein BVRB_6g144050 [Beta vulgaris subsp. vulgaris]|uniref:Uncharacterized protein n=1 Tax=Beta vulgaris subsp. vulgaris TaxID=3555 RepID=A0A0J8C2R8_BETVV|nr:hypothetical protein BVRB_6g144050 [Beta vulgaris subsp. vulgaris]
MAKLERRHHRHHSSNNKQRGERRELLNDRGVDTDSGNPGRNAGEAQAKVNERVLRV